MGCPLFGRLKTALELDLTTIWTTWDSDVSPLIGVENNSIKQHVFILGSDSDVSPLIGVENLYNLYKLNPLLG